MRSKQVEIKKGGMSSLFIKTYVLVVAITKDILHSHYWGTIIVNHE